MLRYRDISFEEILIIKDLWNNNRAYHENISEFFGHLYENMVFEERIDSFKNYDNEHIKITVAEDTNSGNLLGYCISTYESNQGQTQSLHVLENSRGLGIGKSLMNQHLKWLKDNSCEYISITVAWENDKTIEFYRSLGFKFNTIEMGL